MLKRIAVIPARGGSKRVKNKNIKDLCGRPLIQYSITQALNTELFDRVIVSTDSELISRVAADCGAEVPFLRPSHLAGDAASSLEVLEHVVENIWRSEDDYLICFLQPTSPFGMLRILLPWSRWLNSTRV